MKDGKVEIEAKGVKAGHFAVEVDVGMVVVEVLVVGQCLDFTYNGHKSAVQKCKYYKYYLPCLDSIL